MPARAIMQCQAAGERLPRCASQTGQTNTPCHQTPAVADVSRIDVQFVAIVVPGPKRSGGRISCTRLLCWIRALSAAAIGFASLCPRLTGISSGEPVTVATARRATESCDNFRLSDTTTGELQAGADV
jgi:hypothetical protein